MKQKYKLHFLQNLVFRCQIQPSANSAIKKSLTEKLFDLEVVKDGYLVQNIQNLVPYRFFFSAKRAFFYTHQKRNNFQAPSDQ